MVFAFLLDAILKCNNEIILTIKIMVELNMLDDFSVPLPLGISLWSWERDTSLYVSSLQFTSFCGFGKWILLCISEKLPNFSINVRRNFSELFQTFIF